MGCPVGIPQVARGMPTGCPQYSVRCPQHRIGCPMDPMGCFIRSPWDAPQRAMGCPWDPMSFLQYRMRRTTLFPLDVRDIPWISTGCHGMPTVCLQYPMGCPRHPKKCPRNPMGCVLECQYSSQKIRYTRAHGVMVYWAHEDSLKRNILSGKD